MKSVDHSWDSVELVVNPRPPPLAAVQAYIPHRPMTSKIQMRGKTVTLRIADLELEVEVLDDGEDSQDLFDQDKYPDHLGDAAIVMLKQNRIPTALEIFAGRVLKCTPLQQEQGLAQISVGDTLAFFDSHRF